MIQEDNKRFWQVKHADCKLSWNDSLPYGSFQVNHTRILLQNAVVALVDRRGPMNEVWLLPTNFMSQQNEAFYLKLSLLL
jgi:hypothetical protein|mmetsp:Transcript_9565/g.17393  ORF Transcript_9565/g.17393 Transcript_9565/m.17393 type:complete len:80 (-) Transcript_9565:359-598(-)